MHTETHFYLSHSFLTKLRFSSTLNGRHLHRSVTERGGQKESRKRGGWREPACRHDLGIVIASQQAHQHSLTARPNNQLRAEDGSQQRRERSPRGPVKASGSDSAAVNSYSGFSRWRLTALDHVSTSTRHVCPLVNLEKRSLPTCMWRKWSERWLNHLCLSTWFPSDGIQQHFAFIFRQLPYKHLFYV